MRDFEKDMEVFSFGQHQDVLTYMKKLKDKKWGLADVAEYVENKMEERRLSNLIDFDGLRIERPRCEECNSELRLRVNAEDEKGKSHSTSWLCLECGREEYSDKTVQEWLEILSEAEKQDDKTEK